MWVRTQNEDALYHVAAVRAVKMISERTYSVIGILLGASTSDSVVLGEYKDYATAKAEVDHMDALLMEGTSCLPYDKRKLNDTTPSFPVNCMGKDGIVPYWNQNVTIPL